jgi:hypothetical protein
MKTVYKLAVGSIIISTLLGCGSGSGEDAGEKLQLTSTGDIVGKVVSATQEPGTNVAGDIVKAQIITLKEESEIMTETNETKNAIARVVIPKGLRVLDKEGNNKCECKKVDPCTPCKFTVSRTCGSKIKNPTERLSEAQPTDDTKMALMGAVYDITLNRSIFVDDTISKKIHVKVKLPKCIYDKSTGKYYDFKDNEIYSTRLWIQPESNNKEGYWISPDIDSDGYVEFDVDTPLTHMALFGIVDKYISGGSI